MNYIHRKYIIFVIRKDDNRTVANNAKLVLYGKLVGGVRKILAEYISKETTLLLLFLSGLLTTCKPRTNNFIWLIFTLKFYVVFKNTALRSNLTAFPKINITNSVRQP